MPSKKCFHQIKITCRIKRQHGGFELEPLLSKWRVCWTITLGCNWSYREFRGVCNYCNYTVESRYFEINRTEVACKYWNLHGLLKWKHTFSCFYILLTMHHVMILFKWPTWRTILFYVFIYIFNSVHVSSTSCSSSGGTNCVNTTSGSCHSMSVGVSCAGRKWNFRPAHDTATDSYQRLYWHNLSLLMMSTMCSKHAES